MSDKANAPVKEILAGVECLVYPASQYAGVDVDVADERKGDKSAGAVARQMAAWAGIRGADNFRWMLEEMLADSNRASFKAGQVCNALKSLLFALHARPMHGYPLLPLEEAIANAIVVLDAQTPGTAQ